MNEISKRKNLQQFVNKYLGREVPFKVKKDPVLQARVDHGRWIVDCPYCAGAELVDFQNPYFFCLSCKMVSVDGQYLNVQIPSDHEAVEKELRKMPFDHQRNWRP